MLGSGWLGAVRGAVLGLLVSGAALAAAQGAAQSTEPASGPKVRLELLVDGLVSPLTLHAPGGDERLFVIDQAGLVWIIQDGKVLDEPFLDLRDRMVQLDAGYDERGLLGLAFHPDYGSNGRFYVNYSAPLAAGAPEGWNHTAHVSEFTASQADPNRADPASERVLLAIDEPQMNHNGGTLEFGPDGYLYAAFGDGGAANDVAEGHPPLGNGQDVSTLLGSLLRIDVDSRADGAEYAVPADNPLVGVELDTSVGYAGSQARPEIYLWGLRNPYRFSFDRETGEIWIPDVGQNLFEEVNVVSGPGNLGWNLNEGLHRFHPDKPDVVPTDPPATEGYMGEQLVAPVFEYTREKVDPDDFIGITVIAGYVYRGSQFPELVGRYVFGDWGQSFVDPTGTLVVAEPIRDGSGAVTGLDVTQVTRLDEFVMGFGQGADGELYLLTTGVTGPEGSTGKVYHLVVE